MCFFCHRAGGSGLVSPRIHFESYDHQGPLDLLATVVFTSTSKWVLFHRKRLKFNSTPVSFCSSLCWEGGTIYIHFFCSHINTFLLGFGNRLEKSGIGWNRLKAWTMNEIDCQTMAWTATCLFNTIDKYSVIFFFLVYFFNILHIKLMNIFWRLISLNANSMFVTRCPGQM